MTPHLTARGKAALAVALLWMMGSGVMLLLNRHLAAWPLMVAASAVLLLLLVAFMASVPLARVLDGVALGLEVETPDEGVALHTDEVVFPRVRLANRSGLRLRRLVLRPELSTALSCREEEIPEVFLPAASRAELPVPIVSRRSGRWFIHGFHVACHGIFELFVVRNYLPAPHALTFLPRGLVERRQANMRQAAAMLHERIGVHEVRQRGFGTDLREIRDHQHGDPFRNIAWKATARTGKLMVREFESEISVNAYLVVDISATMRGFTERGGKLEHAIRLAANFARAILRGNDRCGLITFDEKVYGHLPPREGPAQMMRISQHLLGTSTVVDETLTEYDEDEVVESLVRYLMLQRRLDFRRREPRRRAAGQAPEVEDVYDIELLNRWLRRELDGVEVPASLKVGVLHYEQLSLARRFCHLYGVEIPYRSELRYGTKEQGLIDALEVIMKESRNPHIVLVVSDLAGLVDSERLARVLRLAVSKRHKVAIVAPFTPNYVAAPSVRDDAQGAVVYELFSAAESRERRAVLRALRGAGVPVLEVGPEARIGPLLKQLRVFA